MKKKSVKIIAMVLACVCLLSIAAIGASAETISITYKNGTARAYSSHEHYTPANNQRVYTVGNCVQNAASSGGAVYANGQVIGSTTYKQLKIQTRSSAGNITECNQSSNGSITWNNQLTFNKGYDTTIHIEATGNTGSDKVKSNYVYNWGYSSSFGGMTITTGTYTYSN